MGSTGGSGRRASVLGTFAVTVGVGLAVATGTAAVAAASPHESGDTSTTAAKQHTDTSGDRPDTSSTSVADGDGVTPDSDESAAESETPSANTDSEDEADEAEVDLDADIEVDTPDADEAAEPPLTEADSTPRDAHTGRDRSGPAVATSPSPEVTTVATTAVPDPADATAETPTPPTPRAARLLKLFGTTLPQHVAESPASPRLKTFLLGILNSVYRRYEHFYLNGAPTADPRQLITRPEDGVVIGSLNATDPDGDELRFLVTQQGAFGRLTVDSNGIWTYRRAWNAPRGAYTDTITIAIEDRGLDYSDVIAAFGFQPNRTVLNVLTDVPPLTSSPAPATAGFVVVNQTSDWLTVARYESADFRDKLYNPPAVGTRIAPGAMQSFEMIYYFLIGGRYEAVSIAGPQAVFLVDFNVTLFGIPITTCTKTSSVGRAGSCSDPLIGVGNTVVIRD